MERWKSVQLLLILDQAKNNPARRFCRTFESAQNYARIIYA